MIPPMPIRFLLFTILFISATACKNIKEKPKPVQEERQEEEYVQPEESKPIKKEPIINIEELQVSRKLYMVMKESVYFAGEIERKKQTMYSNIEFTMDKCGIELGGIHTSWTYSNKEPYTVEVGIPVFKKCAGNELGIYYKERKACKVLIARYYGPYDEIYKAYNEMYAWVKRFNKTVIGQPWEEYVSKGSVEKDVFRIETDVYFQIKDN